MVKVVSIVQGADSAHGSTVTVTLGRGRERVTCEDILLWDETQVDDYLFDTWRELALDGEEGLFYGIWTENIG